VAGPETGLLPSSDNADDRRKRAEEAFEKRLARYGNAHARQLAILAYLKDLKDAEDGKLSPVRDDLHKIDPNESLGNLIGKLENCASWLYFHLHKETGKRSLYKTSRCNKDLLCPFCAIQRGAKHLFQYQPKFLVMREKNPDLIPVLLTLTVKNGFDLNERVGHLFSSLRKFKDKRRNKKNGGRCVTEFSKIAGAIGSYELSYSEEHGWHPHLHMIVFLEDYIDVRALSREWLAITGDSMIVDVRLIDEKNLFKSLNEVFKYALKFHSLTPSQTYECYQVLKNRKKLFTLGVMRSIEVEEEERKKQPYDDLVAYRFLDGGYRFQYSKTVEEIEEIKMRFR